MKIEGHHTIKAPRELAWNLMIDPEVLGRCVPGVQSLEATGDGTYKMVLKTGIGSIKGLFNGTIRLEEMREPEHYKMTVDGRGAPGFVKGAGTLDLAEQGAETVVTYAGDVSVGGTIAGVGQRMILSSAKMMTAQFFAALEAEAAAIIKAEENGEPVVTPKQGFFRNVFRATSGTIKRRLNK
ncbi:MAG TPA: carbon monoxide dehydrogenase subunit G [Blastocatellia bacterium]|nr:carbon monoxide dehydrogenase subunit G [Blastocatellia bacterium]